MVSSSPPFDSLLNMNPTQNHFLNMNISLISHGEQANSQIKEQAQRPREGRLMKVMDEEERLREIYEGKGEEELQMMKILEDEIRSVVRLWMKILKWLKR
ncbi:unnamed protein product [Vicia faba]|uniref:Uncharacterized protein n=1 Tax=Vicia faba TaxID=3906 RepID=A0AAV0Z1B1_VICFA|nr:unnamed protein product [Vicia faba]